MRSADSKIARYGVSVLAILLACAVRYGLDPVLGGGGFIVFFAAVIVVAWHGGVGPALLSLALSMLASMVFFRAPPGAAEDSPAVIWIGFGLFCFIAVTSALLSESMRAARRRAEANAAEAFRQREQMRATLACIGDAVIVTDGELRLTMINAVAESLTGWTGAEAVGRPLETVYRTDREASAKPTSRQRATSSQGAPLDEPSNQVVLVRKDGVRIPIDASFAPIQDAEGRTTGEVVIFRDVTERRRTEQALRDADRRKDEFLAVLAHELRNPLAPISTALQLLRAPSMDAAADEWAKQVIERQTHHLVRLVDDLLDVSRIMRGKIELRNETVELRSIFDGAVETAQSLIDSKGHELIVSLPPAPILLTTDAVRLAQVVGNLLTNAAKYTEPGGRIQLSGERKGQDVVIKVYDSGIGIPADLLPRVFEPFTQIESSVAHSQGGLGIGLSLVKNLVELIGGRVEARSEGPGKGSEFVVCVPAPLPHSIESASRPSSFEAPRRPVSKRRVLVVDDNRDAAKTLSTLLRLDGHDVETVHDGPAAIDSARVESPEVVFLDIGMPEMDGHEVARRLRASRQTAGALLVALTGWGQEEDRLRSKEAGFDHHLTKPVDAGVIRELLAKELNHPGPSGPLNESVPIGAKA